MAHTGVALLAEGVDRNDMEIDKSKLSPVALLAEGVDRNGDRHGCAGQNFASPSSRRAWIEIRRIFCRSFAR